MNGSTVGEDSTCLDEMHDRELRRCDIDRRHRWPRNGAPEPGAPGCGGQLPLSHKVPTPALSSVVGMTSEHNARMEDNTSRGHSLWFNRIHTRGEKDNK